MPTSISGATAIAAVGDLQGTHVGEYLLLRESNHAVTNRLVCTMRLEDVGATVLLGDLVTVGESEGSWERFDDLALRLGGFLLPVRGNHDYWGDDNEADAAWHRRFPWSDRAPWYSLRWGRIGLVFLNSNLSELDATAQIAQQQFYEKQLDQLEEDPFVQGILVFLHHPPYTMNPNADAELTLLRQLFVAPLCRQTKALAMIAGHAHGYERYEKHCSGHAVEFIVSGGGGGPRPFNPPLYDDECLAAGRCHPTERPLNYLLLKQTDELVVEVKAFEPLRSLEIIHLPLADPLRQHRFEAMD